MKTKTILLHSLLGLALLSSCVPLSSATDPGPIYTAAAETIAVTLTYGAVQSSILTEVAATQAPLPTSTPEVTATSQPLPTETLQLTLMTIPTMTSAMITADSNTNCRVYPSGYAKYQSAFMVGQKVAVRGRLANNTWWYIEDPEDSNQSCWVWADTTTVEGDAAAITVVTVPLTPYPSYSISGSISPASYSGACPVTISVSGKIKATAGSDKDISYGWTSNFGIDPGSGVTEFDEAGTRTVGASFQITEDTSGYIRFKLFSPVELSTGKIKLNVDCD
jgi:hypothetical protein